MFQLQILAFFHKEYRQIMPFPRKEKNKISPQKPNCDIDLNNDYATILAFEQINTA